MAPSCDAIIVVRSLSRKVTDIIIFRKKKQGRWIFVNIDSIVNSQVICVDLFCGKWMVLPIGKSLTQIAVFI